MTTSDALMTASVRFSGNLCHTILRVDVPGEEEPFIVGSYVIEETDPTVALAIANQYGDEVIEVLQAKPVDPGTIFRRLTEIFEGTDEVPDDYSDAWS